MDIYQKNLQVLSKKDPLLYKQLNAIKENKKYEVFLGKDSANFNLIDKETHTPLFEKSPLETSLEQYKNFEPYMLYPYLYYFGLGNGVFYRLLLGNENLKRLVVIEPEIEIIFIVLNLLDFSMEILENRLILLHSGFCSYNMIASLFDMDKKSRLYARMYDLKLFNSYYERYLKQIIEINQHFTHALEHSAISVGNDAKDALIGIKQHVANLPEVIQSPSLVHFVNALKNRDVAIIVSTGPSLNKQLPLLKEIAPYATLFCIDASFPILAKAGIKPDIVVSLERVDLTAKFYEETPLVFQEGVIFALTSIVHKRLSNAIKTGVKQFSFRPFGYTNLFNLHQYGYVGIGMSAANMAYELVVHSRFKKCVFIGQDLSFSKSGNSHANGAIYGDNEIKPKSDKDKIFIEKYGGNGQVETTLVWKLFLEFFEKDIFNTPYKLEVINATEGGARIKGTKEIPFKEVCKRIDKTKPKPPINLIYPTKKEQAKNLKMAKEKCEEIIEYANRQKKQIEEVFLKVAKFLEEIEKLNDESKLEELDFKELENLSAEIDNIKELFDDRRFNAYFMDAIQSYIFHQELHIAEIVCKKTNNEDELRAKQLEYIYAHKYWLFSLAGGIDCVIEAIKMALKEW
ncbi:motility associated factor glycosyltransferase family protein [Helicobacter cetorum]|uniref:motility associated factor glycosyltransferase family protein n=1 Tax=Helicobacter cetorum TaxID=138563 RepID=UPI0018F81BF6|nr:motility associated factor glycosyltransferase family protein [Helicobacter cetorum]